MNSHANDAMIRRLEKELEERNSAVQGLIAGAEDAGRDLNDSERETIDGLKTRMSEIKVQLDTLESSSKMAGEVTERMREIDVAITTARKTGNATPVEYERSGDYIVDMLQAYEGSREARERLETFQRAADHFISTDNPGVIPDPVVGPVINFIDAARPVVAALGVQGLPSGTFHRPKVTQSTAVARQTDSGSPEITEKVELTSQAMTVSRLTIDADTYGGYVNVSRQSIDWSNGTAMTLIVNDLAAQYAIQTESAVGDTVAATTTTPVVYGAAPTDDDLLDALWDAAATAYNATKGQGRLVLAVAPDVLRLFGPLFKPVSPRDAASPGFNAGMFGQGVMGNIAGIDTVMSSGLGAGEAFLISTSAVEVWEQRVGTLQVVEPSVLGVQVAYAGYFASLLNEDGGVVPLVEAT